MTNDEKFAADLSAITGKRIDVPKAETDEFSTSGFETREEKHQKDSIAAHEEAYYTVMRNMYLTAQAESQQAEIRALHEVMRAIHTAMSKYEDDNLSGYTVVAPPTSGH